MKSIIPEERKNKYRLNVYLRILIVIVVLIVAVLSIAIALPLANLLNLKDYLIKCVNRKYLGLTPDIFFV